jgi:hypothetical protein
MLTQTQKSQLKLAAAYIKGLLEHLEEWVEKRDLLQPDKESSIRNFWPLFGRALDTLCSEESESKEIDNLDEDVSHLIEESIDKYILLSTLFLKAEKLLHAEGPKRFSNWSESFKCSDFLRFWAADECRCEILLHSQTHWEGYSVNQWKERKRETVRHSRNKIKDSRWQLIKARWDKEDAKLFKGDPPPEFQMPFMDFCIDVFKKNRKDLPEFARLTELSLNEEFSRKPVIINGRSCSYPGRGSSKKNSSP